VKELMCSVKRGAPCDKKYFMTSEVGNDGVKFVFDERYV
jgi:hypothetical protein